MTKLFVSYSRVDTAVTERLVVRLRRAYGLAEVWYDDELHGGAQWWQTILAQIAACDVFLYLLSNESVTSPYCQAEFTEAKRLGKPIVTVQLRDRTRLSDDLKGIQYVDMKRGIDDENLMRLVGSINKMAELPKVRRALWTPATPLPTVPTHEDADAPRPEVDTPTLIVKMPMGAPPHGDRTVARATIIAAAITGILGVLAVVVGVILPPILNATPTLPPTALTENVAAPTAMVGVPTDSPSLPPASSDTPMPPTLTDAPTTTPSDTPVPPTPTDTETPTPNPEQREATLQALMLSIQNEQALALAAQESATADSLTATADSWTDTPVPPTPDDRATAVALLAATELQAHANQTATAESWTDTPTTTRTPTVTSTPSRTPTPLPPTPVPELVQLASTPVNANADWTPVSRDFDGVSMVLVPVGCFSMGSNAVFDEQPVHEQCFDQPFWIDRYEVTNGQYGSSGRFSGNDLPRERVNWFDARAFCERRGARLPTESEWEYTARGPDNLVYPWGNAWDETKAVWSGNSNGQTADVGSIAGGASWVGALDLSGNVYEWTSSLYRAYPYNISDGREQYDNRTDARVVRGGSWFDSGTYLRGATRYWNLADDEYSNNGFRCARSQ